MGKEMVWLTPTGELIVMGDILIWPVAEYASEFANRLADFLCDEFELLGWL